MSKSIDKRMSPSVRRLGDIFWRIGLYRTNALPESEGLQTSTLLIPILVVVDHRLPALGICIDCYTHLKIH